MTLTLVARLRSQTELLLDAQNSLCLYQDSSFPYLIHQFPYVEICFAGKCLTLVLYISNKSCQCYDFELSVDIRTFIFVGSGGILRCDVLVDAIHRLEIITTTRELYVEEAPEEFEVRAYDDQGGLIFKLFKESYFMSIKIHCVVYYLALGFYLL